MPMQVAVLALVLAACAGPSTVERNDEKPVAAGADGRPLRDPVAEVEREARIRRLLGQETPPRGETLDGRALERGGAGAPPIPDADGGDAGPLPRFERFELVTATASVRDGTGTRPGNSWGGHQTRVLRMRNGDVYTAYLTSGATFDSSRWQLVRRDEAGWQRVASGLAGREPVNILRTPGDGVALVAWPNGNPLLTTLDFSNGTFARRDAAIPGQWETSHWPYNAAGIGLDGTLCALQSMLSLSPGAFLWACRSSPDGPWDFHKTSLEYRHCYAYVLPQGRQLTLVATRDVLWSTIGAATPPGAFAFAFDQVHAYGTADRGTTALVPTLVREEVPTPQFPEPMASGHIDAYVDTEGRLHVLYRLKGQSTAGLPQTRHALVVDGRVVADVALPEEGYWRITQDSTGRFWGLFGTGARFAVYPALSADGLRLGSPTVLDLGGEQVIYSGMAIAAPRAGVPLADIVDGGFPSGRSGERWVYFRLRLR